MSAPPPWRVRLIDGGMRTLRRASALLDAAASGVALGLMHRDHIHALDRLYYHEGSIYHTPEHNCRGLFDWEREAVERWFTDCRTLVVVGAGGGREVLALAEHGYDVDGFECNDGLMAAASGLLTARGCPSRVLPIEPDAAPSTTRRYDGIIIGWSAYGLIPGRARRIGFLSGMAEPADPGSPLLLSFFTRAADHRRYARVAGMANAVRRLHGAEPAEVGDDLAPNYIHRFTEDEVRREMHEAGFELVAFALQGRRPHDAGWAVGRRR